MKNIKLVLVDIDGTLLNDEGIITPKTINAISKLKENNIMFGIATGRTPFAVKHLIKDWKIDQYVDIIMGFNGGCYLNMKTGTTKSCYLLDGKYIPSIFDDFKQFSFNAGIYDQESFHVLKKDPFAIKIAQSNKLPLVIDDFTQYYDKQIEKMLFIAEPNEIEKINNHFNTLTDRKYRAVRSTPILFEFLNPQLSKSKGIQMICKDFHITSDNVLTFGDELNDYEMIKDYHGVAMGNANPEIKSIAQYMTKSNNDDGIADFLIKHSII